MFRELLAHLKAWRYSRQQDRRDKAFERGRELRSTAARLQAAIKRSDEEHGRGNEERKE